MVLNPNVELHNNNGLQKNDLLQNYTAWALNLERTCDDRCDIIKMHLNSTFLVQRPQRPI